MVGSTGVADQPIADEKGSTVVNENNDIAFKKLFCTKDSIKYNL